MVVSYLKNEGNVRDPKKPFFIMVGMNPPHSPYRSLDDCMEEDFNLYKDQPLDSLLIRPNADKKREKAESVRYYFASVTGVDRAFGQILETLKEQGLDIEELAAAAYEIGRPLPWQHLDMGFTEAYLISEWQKAQREEFTPMCFDLCRRCGVCGEAQV